MSVSPTALPKSLVSNQADAQAFRAVLHAKERPARPNAIDASITFFWRAVLKIKHVPMQLLDVTMFPIMITLMFTFMFGGALAGSVDAYVQILIPGILVMTVSMISMYTAMAVNTDITKGIFDRFRTLPFWRPAVLVGALLGDTVRYTMAAAVVLILGVLLGFRPDAGFANVIPALLVLLVFAFSMSWIWTVLGLLLPTPESVMMTSSMLSFPLSFASNVFVDPATMPEWLQFFVRLNPMTHAVTAVRGLLHGTLTGEHVLALAISCVALIAIFAPLTMYLYSNKNRR